MPEFERFSTEPEVVQRLTPVSRPLRYNTVEGVTCTACAVDLSILSVKWNCRRLTVFLGCPQCKKTKMRIEHAGRHTLFDSLYVDGETPTP